MPNTIVAMTSDNGLVTSLEDAFKTAPTINLEVTASHDNALDRLKAAAIPTLLLDVRPGFFSADAHHTIHRLASGELPAVNVITIGNDWLPAATAAGIELLECRRVDVPSAAGMDEIKETVASIIESGSVRPVPESRQVTGEDVSIVTYTPEFFSVVDDIVRVAAREVTILLVGETGTGKTTLARFVHELSPRKHRQFQDLACGALPSDLIESELFGHTRGAFTGADRTKIGRFEAAGRGTLLLDEIDVMDLKQQTKLLKVIETGYYEMVGSTETRRSEARLIVASNVNLQDLTEQNKFRTDLYYRLNVLEFRLPSLRDRTLDIAFLATQFIQELSTEHDIPIERVHRDFLHALRNYEWLGNLRELKNHVRRAVLFSHNAELTVNELSHKILSGRFAEGSEQQPQNDGWTLADRVAQSEREMLLEALHANGNNRTRTARTLGISRVGLYKKMRRLGLLEEAARSV